MARKKAAVSKVPKLGQGDRITTAAQLEAVFRAAPTGIGVVVDRVIVRANERLCAMTGYSAEELLGRSARMLYLTDQDYEYVGQEKYEQIRQRGTGTVETRWVRKDGTLIEVLLSSTPLDAQDFGLGVTFTALDITARKRAEADLRESEALYRDLVATSQDLIWQCDGLGRYTYLNPAWQEVLGYPPEEMLGRRFTEFASEKDAANDLDKFGLLLAGGILKGHETIHRTKDGRPVHLVFNATNVKDPLGRVVGTRGTAYDITARLQAEAARLALERQVQHAQKLESLGVLAGGIAHDFNNLLMGILGNADLALAQLAPLAPARQNLGEIEKAARRASDLARQMLAYSGKGKFVVEPIDLSALVSEMAHLLEVSISKKVILQYEHSEAAPPLDGDATQIRQVIMNLIINASEAIGDHSGAISLRTGAVDCDLAYLNSTSELIRAVNKPPLAEGLYAFIEVSDSGSGMDADTQKRIFDPFFTTKFTGRGLGLAAVLGIVRGHHGTIKIYSEPGRGTTFKILFPCSSRAAVGSSPERAANPAARWQGSGTVLLADDEEIVRSVVTGMLQHLGFAVRCAVDGRDVLRVFEANAADICCVLLDLTMPHLDGEQAFRELRRLRPEVKVVLCSGYNEQEATQHFVGKGLAGFLQKPFKLSALRDLLNRVLGSPEPAR